MEKICCFVSVSCLRHFVRPILPRVQDPHKPQVSERKIPLWKLSLHFFFWKITAGLYGWPKVLFSTIFPYCRPWLQAIYVPVKLKLQHPPPGHLTVHRAREGGNLNVALEGWEIWTRFISSFSVICPWVFRFLQGLTDFQGRILPLLMNNALKTVFK